MTILGKMMVFLVMLLSFVWCGLVVNAYVTRTNWKTEADFYKAQAQESAQAAEQMKQQLIAQRNAHNSESQALKASNAQLVAQINDSSDQSKVMEEQYTKVMMGLDAQKKQTTVWKTNIDLLESQVSDLTTTLKTNQTNIDGLVLQASNDRVAKQEALLDAKAQMQRANDLSEKLQTSRQQATQRADGTIGTPGQNTPDPLPEGWNGTVRNVTPDGYVEMTPGLDSGLEPEHTLLVYRQNPSKFLGTIRVRYTNPKDAVGMFSPANPREQASAANRPQAGDIVKPYK